jgi:hypothetical protein
MNQFIDIEAQHSGSEEEGVTEEEYEDSEVGSVGRSTSRRAGMGMGKARTRNVDVDGTCASASTAFLSSRLILINTFSQLPIPLHVLTATQTPRKMVTIAIRYIDASTACTWKGATPVTTMMAEVAPALRLGSLLPIWALWAL